jgi:uncharacterized membrane protein AbrB (regulator of aidB expression)
LLDLPTILKLLLSWVLISFAVGWLISRWFKYQHDQDDLQ